MLTPNPVNTIFQTQVGAVRSTGFEAQLVANIADGLNLVASFTKFDFSTIRDADPIRVGKTPVNIPQTLASLFADYTIPVGPWRGFGFGGGVRYVGSSFADVANTLRVPDYVLFDAQVHYDVENWRFQVNASNIGDRRYVASCQSNVSCFYGDAGGCWRRSATSGEVRIQVSKGHALWKPGPVAKGHALWKPDLLPRGRERL